MSFFGNNLRNFTITKDRHNSLIKFGEIEGKVDNYTKL